MNPNNDAYKALLQMALKYKELVGKSRDAAIELLQKSIANRNAANVIIFEAILRGDDAAQAVIHAMDAHFTVNELLHTKEDKDDRTQI